MKVLILMLGLCLGAVSHGADRKLGHVIVVERALSNIYADCIAGVHNDTTKPSAFFSCAIPVTTQPYEVLLSKDRSYHHSSDKCTVDSEFIAGKLLITFGATRDQVTFEVAKTCLADVIAKQAAPVVLIQTIESL